MWICVLANPLTNLLKKGTFQWTPNAQEAFSRLKQAMTSSLVLRLPKFREPFVVETDASDKGIGAVLMQQGKLIAYLSKTLSPLNQAKLIYKKELMVVLTAVDH